MTGSALEHDWKRPVSPPEYPQRDHGPMSYNSFLLRCWWPEGSGDRRPAVTIAVEHVQSGEQTRTTSWEDAIRWMEAADRSLPEQESESKE